MLIKPLFRSYPHDQLVLFKQWERASNLNDRVDLVSDHFGHIKMIFK